MTFAEIKECLENPQVQIIEVHGAQIQVQSDWEQESDQQPSYIRNKPSKLSEFENDLFKWGAAEW